MSVDFAHYLFILFLLINSLRSPIFFQKPEGYLGIAVEQSTVTCLWVGLTALETMPLYRNTSHCMVNSLHER